MEFTFKRKVVVIFNGKRTTGNDNNFEYRLIARSLFRPII